MLSNAEGNVQDRELEQIQFSILNVSFRNFRLTMQEYVCLKVVAMLSNAEGNVQDRELEQIHSRYMNCLRTFIEYNYPQEPNRVQELLVKLPEVQEAAGLLLESKMFYVPFLLNSTISSGRTP